MKDTEKVSVLKNLRFLTNKLTEWDERYGYLKKDAKAIMELVRKECAANYPYVDIDDFIESYKHFDNAPLRTSLTTSRISHNQWNMRDENAFISVMRHLVLRDESLPTPTVRRRDILEQLEQENPAVTFLVYFHPDGNAPILPPPQGKPGDNKNDYSLYLNSIADAMRKIHNRRGFFKEPPLLSVMMSQFNAINASGNSNRMVRMDIINLVSGVLNNITNNSASEALHDANISALENRVDIGLRTDVLWRSNTNQIWQVDGSDGCYILTRYAKTNGERTYEKFILNVYRGEESQIVGSLESPDMVKNTLYGEAPATSFATLDMTDEDGARLLGISDGTGHGPVKIKFSPMSKSTIEPSQLLNCAELHIMTAKERETDCDALQNIEKGLYNVCASECDLPTRPQEVLMSAPYIYLSCETEDISARAKGQDNAGAREDVGMRVKSWLRIPRWTEYTSRLGDTTDLTDITEHDRPSWRRFRNKKDGKMVEVVYFALHNIAIDVTLSMHPQDGCELPHGIVVVRSPSSTILPSGVTYVRVKSARARVNASGCKADVTYEYSKWDEDVNRECVVEEEIVSVPEVLPY